MLASCGLRLPQYEINLHHLGFGFVVLLAIYSNMHRYRSSNNNE